MYPSQNSLQRWNTCCVTGIHNMYSSCMAFLWISCPTGVPSLCCRSGKSSAYNWGPISLSTGFHPQSNGQTEWVTQPHWRISCCGPNTHTTRWSVLPPSSRPFLGLWIPASCVPESGERGSLPFSTSVCSQVPADLEERPGSPTTTGR